MPWSVSKVVQQYVDLTHSNTILSRWAFAPINRSHYQPTYIQLVLLTSHTIPHSVLLGAKGEELGRCPQTQTVPALVQGVIGRAN